MQEYQLGQALLVDPTVSFDSIAATLARLGWERQDGGPATAPLIAGEPESASWWWHGKKPFVIYTFNPAVKLRVLDVATVPPVMRGAITSALPILDDTRLARFFESQDPRERLLALWAAQEIEQIDMIGHADRLTRDPDPMIAQQAVAVRDRLRRINEARYEALASLRVITEGAPKLIARFNDFAFIQSIKPDGDALATLFDEDLKPILTNAVEAIYGRKIKTSRLEPDAKIQVFAITAGMLRWPNMLSEKFPLGYRDIAGWMNPRRVWLAWTITTPTGGTVRYDGLAWLDGRWVWLPKIYRYIAPYLLEDMSEP